MKKLLSIAIIPRSLIICTAFMVLMWLVFYLGQLTHPQAWSNPILSMPVTGWEVLWFILMHNIPLALLIVIGNLFVRFGDFTPGLLILGIRAVSIGWTAGTNSFIDHFSSVSEANLAFLRIGLWETTAYVLICAVTLTKSLYVADSFPAKRWIEIKQLKDIRFTSNEYLIIAVGACCLLWAAFVEAFLPFGL